MARSSGKSEELRTLKLAPYPDLEDENAVHSNWAELYPVFYPAEIFKLAKAFWQHTGEGISSRHAEYYHALFDELTPAAINLAVERSPATSMPRLCNKDSSPLAQIALIGNADDAKYELRKQIAALASTESCLISVSDVFLYATGMSAISSVCRADQIMLRSQHPNANVAFG